MFRRLRPLVFGAMCMAALPAHAATCVEGLAMLENTLRGVTLNEEERGIVTDLMFKARVEANRGNPQAQAARFSTGDRRNTDLSRRNRSGSAATDDESSLSRGRGRGVRAYGQ